MSVYVNVSEEYTPLHPAAIGTIVNRRTRTTAVLLCCCLTVSVYSKKYVAFSIEKNVERRDWFRIIVLNYLALHFG